MRHAGLALLALFAIGCGPEIGSSDFPVRDFSVGDQSMDMSVGGGDLASADQAIAPDLAPLTCDLGSGDAGAGARLTLAAVTTGGTLYVATLAPGGGWSALAASGSSTLAEVTLVRTDAGPEIAARQSDSALLVAEEQPCLASFALAAPFSAASTGARPALAGGTALDLVFKGGINSDERLYHASSSGGAWSAAVAQSSFLTTLAPAAVREPDGLHAIFTGTDAKLYDGAISDGAGGGTASAVYDVNGNRALSSLAPAAVVGQGGTTYVIFTGQDTNLYWTRKPSGGSYAQPAQLCTGLTNCFMTSNQAPVVSLDATGAPIVAFQGKDRQIYTSTLTLGSSPIWSAAIAASQSGEKSDLPPALAPGIGIAQAELLYVRAGDGYGRHVRLTGGSWTDGETIATPLASAPALVSTP